MISNCRRTLALRQFFAAVLIIAAVLVACAFTHGCIQEAKEVAAASGYEAQQQRCIDQYARREDIDRCRDKVKAAWAKDAGGDR